METIALYMRLSSEDANEGESIANQRDLLYDFVRSRREFDSCQVLEFCDDGCSGVNFNRPGIQKLLSLVGKTVDCIIVKDFSRFGRNLIEVGDYLDQIFPFLGVRFIAVNEGYDSGQGHGSTVSLDVSLKALVYEMYSRDISEKIRCVQQAKMRKGEYLCAIAFYGYKRSTTKKNSLEPDRDAAEVVQRIFSMAAEGRTALMIAACLNRDGVPSPLMYRREKHTDGGRGWKTADVTTYWTGESVRRIIHDERYTGCLVAHRRTVSELSTKKTKPVPKEEWIVVENTHEAIVTKEIFKQAQQALKEPLQRNVRRPYQKFRGLLKCACCNRTLLRSKAKKPYYICPTAKTVMGRACADIRLEEAVLEETLLTAVQIQIQLFQDTTHEEEKDAAGLLQEEIKACQSTNSRYKSLQTALFEDYAEGRIDRQKYLLKKQELLLQQEETKNRFEELTSQLVQLQGQQEKVDTDLGKYVCVNELTREMLEELVKEIRVSGKDTLEIKWNFKDSLSENDEKNQ